MNQERQTEPPSSVRNPQSEIRNLRLVIVGGGFAGLTLAQSLARAPVAITLLDRRNFHLFQPLLYQVATGGLSPANIAAPLRAVLKRQKNAAVRLAEVVGFDLANKVVKTTTGDVPFDLLAVAAGVTHSYFGHPEWAGPAPGLKTLEDATEIRRRILLAFETAETLPDPAAREPWLTFAVVGGGPTGVELAGAIGELAHHTLRGNFRNFNPADAKVVLLEGADRLLLAYPPKLAAKAKRALEKLGVTVCLNAKVTMLEEGRAVYEQDGRTVELAERTILWAAGVQASPLGKLLAEAAGAATDRQGRLIVGSDLTLPGRPDLFVLGDLASCPGPGGKPLPGVAPVAMQQGRHAARTIRDRLKGRATPPFKYRDKGSMATIGRGAAVADLGWLTLTGFLAWMAWLFIHLVFLVGFANRLMVLLQWASNYLTRNRAARLITGSRTSSP